MLVHSDARPHSAAGAHPTHARMVVVVVVQGDIMEGRSDIGEGDLNRYFLLPIFILIGKYFA